MGDVAAAGSPESASPGDAGSPERASAPILRRGHAGMLRAGGQVGMTVRFGPGVMISAGPMPPRSVRSVEGVLPSRSPIPYAPREPPSGGVLARVACPRPAPRGQREGLAVAGRASGRWEVEKSCTGARCARRPRAVTSLGGGVVRHREILPVVSRVGVLLRPRVNAASGAAVTRGAHHGQGPDAQAPPRRAERRRRDPEEADQPRDAQPGPRPAGVRGQGRHPRVVPIAFAWNGTEVVMCTTTNAAKLASLRRNPAVALTIDTEVHPRRSCCFEAKRCSTKSKASPTSTSR
jgi:hypothetical protein